MLKRAEYCTERAQQCAFHATKFSEKDLATLHDQSYVGWEDVQLTRVIDTVVVHILWR